MIGAFWEGKDNLAFLFSRFHLRKQTFIFICGFTLSPLPISLHHWSQWSHSFSVVSLSPSLLSFSPTFVSLCLHQSLTRLFLCLALPLHRSIFPLFFISPCFRWRLFLVVLSTEAYSTSSPFPDVHQRVKVCPFFKVLTFRNVEVGSTNVSNTTFVKELDECVDGFGVMVIS